MNKTLLKLTLEFIKRGFEEDEAMEHATIMEVKMNDALNLTHNDDKGECINNKISIFVDAYLEDVKRNEKKERNTYRVFTISTRDMETSASDLLEQLGKAIRDGVKVDADIYNEIVDEDMDPIEESIFSLNVYERFDKKFGISERIVEFEPEEDTEE